MSRLHDGAERGFKLDDSQEQSGARYSGQLAELCLAYRLAECNAMAMDLLPCVSVCEVSHSCFSYQPSSIPSFIWYLSVYLHRAGSLPPYELKKDHPPSQSAPTSRAGTKRCLSTRPPHVCTLYMLHCDTAQPLVRSNAVPSLFLASTTHNFLNSFFLSFFHPPILPNFYSTAYSLPHSL
jgi:hypothetical protein